VLKEGAHGTTSATPAAVQGAANTAFHRYDPALPPLSAERTLRLHWHAREVPVRVSADTVVAAWTFEGDVPGPVVHCRIGDTVEFTLTNDVLVPHSMDFHAAQIDPKVAFRSVAQGQSVTFTFGPKWAGAFMYHCGTAPVLMRFPVVDRRRQPRHLDRRVVSANSVGDLVDGDPEELLPLVHPVGIPPAARARRNPSHWRGRTCGRAAAPLAPPGTPTLRGSHNVKAAP
jgi:plastocyanin